MRKLERKLKITELKKQLKEYDQKELIGLIAELYILDKNVQEFLSVKLIGGGVIEKLFEDAKQKIKDEFFPVKGHGKLRLVAAKKAISKFKKLTNNQLKTVDLMLFYVESGTEFTLTYGDIDGKFYDSMESMYAKVIFECEESKVLFDEFHSRLYSIVEKTDGIGWGYHDGLCDLYYSLSWLEEDEFQ